MPSEVKAGQRYQYKKIENRVCRPSRSVAIANNFYYCSCLPRRFHRVKVFLHHFWMAPNELLNNSPLVGTWEDSHGRDSIQVPKVWQELLTIKLLRDTGEKPVKCTKCDKCFSRSSSLKEHERTHTEEKTFNCSKCDKGFSKSDHIKTLANPHCRPFKCTLWIEIFGTTGCSRAEKFLDE